MNQTLQFSASSLIVIITVYALMLGLVLPITITWTQFAVAIGVATIFIVVDLLLPHERAAMIPGWSRASISIAHFATAIACASVSSVVVFFLDIDATIEESANQIIANSETPTSLSEGIKIVAKIVVFTLVKPFLCVVLSSICSTLGLAFALSAAYHYRRAKWYVMLNIPGPVVLGSLLFCISSAK